MKKKETIQILKYFQEWRRWGDWDQPDPNDIGKAIDNAIATLESKWFIDYQETYKKKYEDTQAVLDAWVWELRFSNMCNEFLYNSLDEIVSMTTDPLTRKVAELSMERYQTDKLIHARKLFE